MLRHMTLAIFALAFCLNMGCSNHVKIEPGTQVDISGKVNGPDGKPLNNVLIYFQATGGAAQGVNFPVKDGKFAGKINAGKYSYYIGAEGSKSDATLKSLPQGWKESSMERQLEITGGEIEIKF